MEAAGDLKAAWAARNMMQMSDSRNAGDSGSDAACVGDMRAAAAEALEGRCRLTLSNPC